MPIDVPSPAFPPTACDDSAGLRHWLAVVRDVYVQGGHVDLVVIGESDGATTTCWSSCPASAHKREFLRWLSDTINDADAFFVPEQEQ